MKFIPSFHAFVNCISKPFLGVQNLRSRLGRWFMARKRLIHKEKRQVHMSVENGRFSGLRRREYRRHQWKRSATRRILDDITHRWFRWVIFPSKFLIYSISPLTCVLRITEQKAWRKKQLCYKVRHKDLCSVAVTDIIICSRIKKAPPGFTYAGWVVLNLITLRCTSFFAYVINAPIFPPFANTQFDYVTIRDVTLKFVWKYLRFVSQPCSLSYHYVYVYFSVADYSESCLSNDNSRN